MPEGGAHSQQGKSLWWLGQAQKPAGGVRSPPERSWLLQGQTKIAQHSIRERLLRPNLSYDIKRQDPNSSRLMSARETQVPRARAGGEAHLLVRGQMPAGDVRSPQGLSWRRSVQARMPADGVHSPQGLSWLSQVRARMPAGGVRSPQGLSWTRWVRAWTPPETFPLPARVQMPAESCSVMVPLQKPASGDRNPLSQPLWWQGQAQMPAGGGHSPQGLSLWLHQTHSPVESANWRNELSCWKSKIYVGSRHA
jgi:hypothetical protein